MNKPSHRTFSVMLILALLMSLFSVVSPALADNTAQSLPFSQDWTNTGLITINDDWSGVAGVVGFLGQDITTGTGVDPQTLLTVSSLAGDVDVIANQTNTGITNGGVAEFHIADAVVALQGSGTADAPHIIIYLNTTGQSNITVAYNVRDIDGSADNAVQQVALQYRIGNSGNFTNLSAGYIADATTGPSLATLVTTVSVQLPAAAENQAEVQVRIITTNAVGSDEWVGIDDISVSASVVDIAPMVIGSSPTAGATNVAINTNIDIAFSEAVNASGSWFDISCGTSGAHTATVTGGPNTFTLNPDSDFANGESCTVTVLAAQVTDQDANDPPDTMDEDSSFSFTTIAAATPNLLVINEIDYDQPSTDAAEFVEIRNNDSVSVDLSNYSVQMINGNAGGAAQYRLFAFSAVSLAPGDYYVLCANNTTVANCDQDVTPETDLIQNGAPDAVALLFGATIIDTVSYEGNTGAPYTEGSGVGLIDSASGTQSISRCPDGSDTNTNNVDFVERTSTPGTLNACVVDIPPVVSTTSPANGASDVSIGANIDINFSEAVTTSGDWFTITCGTSGAHTAAVSGGPQNYTLDPSADFSFSESCTVTILAANVADQDGAADNMIGNYSFSFTTTAQPFGVCGDPATFIHDIQGTGATSPFNNVPGIIIEGVVIGDYQGAGQLGGYHVQEEDLDADGDPATSEGIFVFNSSTPVNVGDLVRVRGRVFEFSTTGVFLTELSPVTDAVVCNNGNSVAASNVTLPVSDLTDWERYEGMLVNLTQDLTATETFTLGRFGEVSLSVGGRLRNPTNITTPGPLAIAQQDLNNRSRILLDDGNGQQNIDPTIHPIGGLDATNTLRSGYTVHGLTGVLEQRFGVYRVQPVGPVSFDSSTNLRTLAPSPVGGTLKVAALNVLNFFTTLDTAPGLCGPTGGLDCRGANSAFEFDRQRDKIINSILAINPDIAGLMEVQNDASATIQNLVDGLNDVAGPGTYAFINTGTIGTDAIKVAIIYKPAIVTPVGPYAILDSTVDPLFIDTKNRPTLAQTFMSNSTGAELTVVVNHLKSKGSACNDVGDPDTGDGQGNCNVTRTNAAIALVNWLVTDPTGSGDTDFLIVGDMNSYAREDPITTITDAGYTNLLETLIGADAYSYVFDGQSGYLDHALASSSLTSQVTGITEWHNNADEPVVLDYNVEFKTANQINTFYTAEPYRASDHDPVVVGLNLTPPPSVDFFLHGTGPANNPPTLFLDNTSPTAAIEKYRDSSSVKFSGGNLWKEIGTWPAAPALTPGTLFALSDVHAWLGLKNSDDQGTNFDLRVEVSRNGTLVASGESYCITGVTRNPSLAKEVTLSFGSFPPSTFNGTTDVLSLKILTRIGTNGSGAFCGGHSNAVGLRLYFDAVGRPSRFDATFGP